MIIKHEIINEKKLRYVTLEWYTYANLEG